MLASDMTAFNCLKVQWQAMDPPEKKMLRK